MIASIVRNPKVFAQVSENELRITLAFAIERKKFNGEVDVRFAKSNIVGFHNDASVTFAVTVVKRENVD